MEISKKSDLQVLAVTHNTLTTVSIVTLCLGLFSINFLYEKTLSQLPCTYSLHGGMGRTSIESCHYYYGTTDTVITSEDGGGGTTDTVSVRMVGVGPQTLSVRMVGVGSQTLCQ